MQAGTLLRKIWKWLNENLTFVYLFISVILILVPNTHFSPFPDFWGKVVEKVGFIALTSGIFAGVLKSIQFTGLFKEELGKIVSGTEFLKNRKDLPDLWKRISKLIYEEKFPEISRQLEETILENYFPTKARHYNENVVVSVVIHELTDDLVIHYTQTVEYNAVLDSRQTESSFEVVSILTDAKNVDEKNRAVSLMIDGEEQLSRIKPNITDVYTKGVTSKKYVLSCPLTGRKKFRICYKTERKYSLKGENYKLIRFDTITKNVDVMISYPEDVGVSFFGVGIVKDFEPVHLDVVNGMCRQHRDGLILPKQGFGLSFNKK